MTEPNNATPTPDPLAGAQQADPLLSEFWKPETEGETIIGMFAKMQTRRFGRTEEPSESVVLDPAMIFPVGGTPQGYRRMEININAWLRKLIRPNMIGSAIGIRYVGSERTKGGPTPMRKFEVYLIETAKYRGFMERYAPGLDADSDLPF